MKKQIKRTTLTKTARQSKTKRTPPRQPKVATSKSPRSRARVDNLTKKVQRNQLFKIILIAASIIAFFAALIGNLGTIEDFVNKHFFANNHLISELQALSPGENIAAYENTFGTPSFVSQQRINISFCPSGYVCTNTKGYTFVNSSFYLYALTDNNDNVLYFSVTTRDSGFNPVFTSEGTDNVTKQPLFQVKLGKTMFSEIAGYPGNVSYSVSANSYDYVELRYFGRPDNFKDFGFSLNMAGALPDKIQDYLEPLLKYQDNENTTNISKLGYFRENVYVNTFSESAPFVSLQDFVLTGLGVDYNQVTH